MVVFLRNPNMSRSVAAPSGSTHELLENAALPFDTHGRRGAGRAGSTAGAALLALAALIPAIPVAIGVVIGLGQPGAGAAPPARPAPVGFTPVPSRPRAPAKSAASRLPVPPDVARSSRW